MICKMQYNFSEIYQLLALWAACKIQFHFYLEWIILLASRLHLGHLGSFWSLLDECHVGGQLVYRRRLEGARRWSLGRRFHWSNKKIPRQKADAKNSCMIRHRHPHLWKTRKAGSFLTFNLCVFQHYPEWAGRHWRMLEVHFFSFFGYWAQTFW